MKLKENLSAPILFCVILILAGLSFRLADLFRLLSGEVFFASMVIPLLVFFLPLAFYCQVRNRNLITTLKFSFVSLRRIPILSVLTMILLVGILLFRYVGLFLVEDAFLHTPSALDLSAKSEHAVLTVLCGVILPAVLEEVVFRGILMEEYRSYGALWMVGISAVMYAMIHLSGINFLYYLFLGMMLGLIAYLSDSLVPSMIINGVLKFLYLYAHSSVTDYIRQAGKSLLLPYVLIAFLLFLIYLLFLRLERIYRNRVYDEILQSRKEMLRRELNEVQERREGEKKNKKWFKFFLCLKEIYLSPTFLICCGVFVFLVFRIS